MNNTTIALLAITILCSSASQIFQKKAALSGTSNEPIIKKISNANFITGMFLLGLGLVFWLLVLLNTDLSMAYPLLSLNYVFVILFARVCLREHIPTQRWFGSGIIILGVFILCQSSYT